MSRLRDRLSTMWARRPLTLRRYRRLVDERTRRQVGRLLRVAARARLRATWDEARVAMAATTAVVRAERAPPRPVELLTAARSGALALPPPHSRLTLLTRAANATEVVIPT